MKETPEPKGRGSFMALDELMAAPLPQTGLKLPSCEQDFVRGELDTKVGRVPRVEVAWGPGDRLGAVKVRLGIKRDQYQVQPGLYALGNPDQDSPVLVSANYKLSFDTLRGSLPGRDAWILALDTKGINVWCAAGKGTMGTDTLVETIGFSGLDRVVSHKKLILPQLAAPGVSAVKVKKETGFSVLWGPVNARDLPAYLDNGLEAIPEMRIKGFSLGDRAVLVPNEMKAMLSHGIKGLALFQLLGLMLWGWPAGLEQGAIALLLGLGCGLFGLWLGALLLPWLPGRAFSLKGLWPCLFFSLLVLITAGYANPAVWGICLMGTAYGVFMMMNFTGSSTYTSLSGVKLEMRYAVPAEAATAGLGLLVWIAAGFMGKGV
jgi:hypothetical protein